MELSFSCDHCQNEIQSDVSLRGSSMTCSSCATKIAVPDLPFGPGYVIGGYRIISLLGEGAQSDVYRGEQASMRRSVAIKVMRNLVDTASLRRFQREVEAQASLDHPNLVPVYDAGEDGGMHYLVMAEVEGVDLLNYLERNTRVKEPHALLIAYKVASALKAAWTERDLIHRDVKPSNIMVSEEGAVKLLDLGLCLPAIGNEELTRLGATPGTPAYMSPEQGDRDAVLDFRSDIFSLGRTLEHLLSGERPTFGVYENSLESRRPNLQLQTLNLLRRMTAIKPEDRHESWSHLQTELLDSLRFAYAEQLSFVDESLADSLSLPRNFVSSRPAWRRGRLRWLLPACLLGGLLLGLGAWARTLPALQPSIRNVALPGGVRISMQAISPGTFVMGAPASEAMREPDETAHSVSLERRYWMGKTELSQDQFEALVPRNPSKFIGSDFPVESVSWHEAMTYCERLNQLSSIRRPKGYVFRLPTEAEWEYACRGGETRRNGFGQDLHPDIANVNFRDVGLEHRNRNRTSKVTRFDPVYGLHDMHGNVAEWCLDWYVPYGDASTADPVGQHGYTRAVRGGSWQELQRHARSAARSQQFGDVSLPTLGFRIVLGPAVDVPGLMQREAPPPVNDEVEVPDLHGLRFGQDVRLDIGNGFKTWLVSIPTGRYEVVSHVSCTVSRPYWLGKYEVTQGEYRLVAGSVKSQIRDAFRPVDSVNWNEARLFATTLNQRFAGKLPEGYHFRLPTEAEWEYACLSGTGGPWFFGDEERLPEFANILGGGDGFDFSSAPVGFYKASPWGLFDMHGNVAEWVLDAWKDPRPIYDGAVDPVHLKRHIQTYAHIYRGGAWTTGKDRAGANTREGMEYWKDNIGIGFRIALAPDIEAIGYSADGE